MGSDINRIIFVDRSAGLSEAFKLHADLRNLRGSLLIVSKDNIEPGKDQVLRSFRNYQDIFQINYFDVKSRVADFFNSLKELRIMAVYKGVSLLDLSANYFFSEMIPLFYHITLIDKILEREKPSEIYLIGTGIESAIVKIFGGQKGIKIIHAGAKSDAAFSLKVPNNLLLFLRRGKRRILSLYAMFLNSRKLARSGKGRGIIFFAPAERFFVSMLSTVLKYKDSERVVVNLFRPGSVAVLKKQKIPFLDFNGFESHGRMDKTDRDFLEKINFFLYKGSAFPALDKSGSLSLMDLVPGFVSSLISDVLPEKLRQVNALRQICHRFDPQVIVTADSSFDIVLIAKSLSVRCVSVQTGHADEFLQYGPVSADALTVEGDYWKNYLAQRNVDPGRIFVTGPAKFDLDDRDEAFEFPPSKKIVVFASAYAAPSSGMFEYESAEQVYDIFRAVKGMKNVHLAIKLHPFDKNTDFYKKAAADTGLVDYNIITEVDISSVLRKSDLLIAHFSRATYEAVLMDKNVIYLGYRSNYHENDIWDFKKFGAVMTVEGCDSLQEAIEKTLFDREINSRLKAGRQRYIQAHILGPDGRACDRVKNLLDRFVNPN